MLKNFYKHLTGYFILVNWLLIYAGVLALTFLLYAVLHCLQIFFFFLLVYSEMQCITVKHESLQGIGFAKCLGTKPRIQEFQSGSFCYLYSDALN